MFCVLSLAVTMSVQQNAHLHSSALNVFQVVFVVSSGEKSNSVNKLMIHWYDVLFSRLNWKASLQLICYILPLLRNCSEERDLCLLWVPFRLFLSEKADCIFQMLILQEIGQSCSLFSGLCPSNTILAVLRRDQIILTNLKGRFLSKSNNFIALRYEEKKSRIALTKSEICKLCQICKLFHRFQITTIKAFFSFLLQGC